MIVYFTEAGIAERVARPELFGWLYLGNRRLAVRGEILGSGEAGLVVSAPAGMRFYPLDLTELRCFNVWDMLDRLHDVWLERIPG